MQHANINKVAIVGAGWAGLAAAISLARKGVSVTLFEASRIPGGRARKVECDFGKIDNGQHILLGAYVETLKLLESVSPGCAQHDFLRIPLTLNFPGHYQLALPRLPSPFNLLAGLLNAKGLSIKTRLGITRLIRHISSSQSHIPVSMTVEQLLVGQTSQAIELFWSPLCLSALNTPLNTASADVFANVLRDALTGQAKLSDMLLPRTDLSALFPEKALRYLRHQGVQVEMETRVTYVEAGKGKLVLYSGNKDWQFEKIILACAPQHTRHLISHMNELGMTTAKLDAMHYQPIVTTYIDYPHSVRLPSPFIGLNDPSAHFAFDHAYTHSHPGRVSIVVSASHPVPPGGRRGRVDHIHELLQKTLGPLPKYNAWQIIEEKRATFECRVGLIRPGNRTENCNIFLAGDYTQGPYPATLEGAVRSGVQCAEMVWSNS